MGNFIGTPYLQKVLCNCLLGQHNPEDNPMYLGLWSGGTSGTMIKDDIILTAKHLEKLSDTYEAVFTASIISKDKGSSNIDTLKILTASKEALAEKTFTNTDEEYDRINTNLSANREVVVEWRMTVNTTSSDITQTILQTNLTNQESEGE